MLPERPAQQPYTVHYSVQEVITSAGQASRALRPIQDRVQIAAAEGRTDAAAQALRDLAEAGLPLGRGEEIRIRVEGR